jgi:hypothetical protein
MTAQLPKPQAERLAKIQRVRELLLVGNVTAAGIAAALGVSRVMGQVYINELIASGEAKRLLSKKPHDSRKANIYGRRLPNEEVKTETRGLPVLRFNPSRWCVEEPA